MKNMIVLAAFLTSLATPASSQWLGSTTSQNTTYRVGNVIIGGTSLLGSWGTATGGILEIQAADGAWLSLRKLGGPNPQLNIGMSSTYGAGVYASGNIPLYFVTEFAERMRITPSGTIGIGTTLTTNPNGYLLAVKGKIGAKEVQIENTSTTWADYVFDSTYRLQPLTLVEDFVKRNKHLPEIPSAEEVKANGHKLGEMDVLLLKKVEELTLYIIDMNKKFEAQSKALEAQSKIVAEQQKMILELKAQQK